MRSALATLSTRHAVRQQNRNRSASLSALPPTPTSPSYDSSLAAIAASILYLNPSRSSTNLPIYIVNAAAFPSAFDLDYDSLLPYVLARLPSEEELIAGQEYEVIFFAGGQVEGATSGDKEEGPGLGWWVLAYQKLSRATRKKLQRLYIVHPRTWVRVLVGVFGTVVSPKFRRKIMHVNSLSGLAIHLPIEKLLIPPAVYLHDRKIAPEIDVPYAGAGRRAFGARNPLPRSLETGKTRLPRVLRETTSFLLMDSCVKIEGIFRVPPHSVLAGCVKEAYDRGQQWVVWKEKGTDPRQRRSAIMVQPGIDEKLLREIRLEDAYGVHMAASLIKMWYRELRDSIIPEMSYPYLREHFEDPRNPVRSEDLVDLLLPASPESPLSSTSREILTRHLLPTLHAVSLQGEHNKMDPDNLGICFAMALLCGSNQLEDARMTKTIQRILSTAIETWPELREGMGLTEEEFYADLKPPSDSREYEDPLHEHRMHRRSAEDDMEGHSIQMSEEDGSSPHEMRQETGIVTQQAPTLPPRPVRSRAASIAEAASLGATTEVPRRKPAPPIPAPPRYSTIFHDTPRSEEPAEMAAPGPANGMAGLSLTQISAEENAKKGFPPLPEPQAPHPALISVPKRKAVVPDGPPSQSASRSTSGTYSAASSQTDGAADPLPPVSENGFAKPTWAASARPLAGLRPITMVVSSNDGQSSQNLPRVRGPSPGLLKRINSLETGATSGGGWSAGGRLEGLDEQRRGLGGDLDRRKLNLKKASVEDLRRLYEERAGLGEVLVRVGRRTATS
nr:hypothetical protein B0A51_07933 [Rachicladosporium sp. CCFEE 5018]